MKLRGIDFGPILGASGVQGFVGEGYLLHYPWKWTGLLSFRGMTFVAKTVTHMEHQGNMELDEKTFRPKEWFPKCIKAQFFKGNMLNAVGLSNKGLGKLLRNKTLQQHTRPFMISVMSLQNTKEGRLREYKHMAEMLSNWKEKFHSQFGVQINLSCPNTDEDPAVLIQESAEALDIFGAPDIPLVPKYSIASAPYEAIMELEQHEHCDAICVSNTIPYGWEGFGKRYWGLDHSPLETLGGGGVSGKSIKPYVLQYIRELRDRGFLKPINGGGGIMEPRDIDRFDEAGATSFFIGSSAILRPWRVRSIIKRAHEIQKEKDYEPVAYHQAA